MLSHLIFNNENIIAIYRFLLNNIPFAFEATLGYMEHIAVVFVKKSQLTGFTFLFSVASL